MRFHRLVSLVSLSLLAAGCVTIDFTGPGTDNTIALVSGREIANSNGLQSVTWSAKGDELVYVTDGSEAALAYRVADRVERELYRSAQTKIYEAMLTADGAEFVTTSLGNNLRTIRRHSALGTSVLTDRGVGLSSTSTGGARALIISPMRPVAYFVATPDSLFSHARGSGARLVSTGCAAILALSADETELLCLSANREAIIVRADGTGTRSLTLPAGLTTNARLYSWGIAGIQVIYGDGLDAKLYDVQARSTRTVISSRSLFDSTPLDKLSWSADGRVLASVKNVCAQTSGLFSCAKSQWIFEIRELVSGGTTRVAVHNADSISHGLTSVSVSPDSKLLAYTVNGRLYLKELP